MDSAEEQAGFNQMLLVSELMFKLVEGTIGHGGLGPSIIVWDFGKHTLTRKELALTPEEASIASSALEHCTTYIIALELDTALGRTVNDRFNHSDDVVRSACWIARLIRNALLTIPSGRNGKHILNAIIKSM